MLTKSTYYTMCILSHALIEVVGEILDGMMVGQDWRYIYQGEISASNSDALGKWEEEEDLLNDLAPSTLIFQFLITN